MILAAFVLLLGLLGVLPIVVAIPAAIVGGFGSHTLGYIIQRRTMRAHPVVGTEAMIGAEAETLTTVADTGTIRFNNERWNARSVGQDIPPSTRVRIIGLDRLCAIVEVSTDSETDRHRGA